MDLFPHANFETCRIGIVQVSTKNSVLLSGTNTDRGVVANGNLRRRQSFPKALLHFKDTSGRTLRIGELNLDLVFHQKFRNQP